MYEGSMVLYCMKENTGGTHIGSTGSGVFIDCRYCGIEFTGSEKDDSVMWGGNPNIILSLSRGRQRFIVTPVKV